MTYTELYALIQSFTDNDESTFNTTIPDFVKNAEDRIFNLVQEDFFRKNQTGNLTTGNRFLTCPSDFILSFSLAVIDSSSDYHFLEKKHPSFMQEYTPDITYETRFQQDIARLKNRAEARGRRDEYRYDALRSQVS